MFACGRPAAGPVTEVELSGVEAVESMSTVTSRAAPRYRSEFAVHNRSEIVDLLHDTKSIMLIIEMDRELYLKQRVKVWWRTREKQEDSCTSACVASCAIVISYYLRWRPISFVTSGIDNCLAATAVVCRPLGCEAERAPVEKRTFGPVGTPSFAHLDERDG